MIEFVQQDLKGARFDDVYLTRASFHDVELDDATFRMVTMRRTRIHDAVLQDMVIDAELDNVVINGVDVRRSSRPSSTGASPTASRCGHRPGRLPRGVDGPRAVGRHGRAGQPAARGPAARAGRR